MTEYATQDAIVIERSFDAPVELIWQMWTEAEHFKHWYGPTGFSVTVKALDAQVGGKRHFCMESAEFEMKMWLAGEYLEVAPHTRLVFTEVMADEEGNYQPENEFLPGITEVTVLLEALDGRTNMKMTHVGLPANAEGAAEGWTQSFDIMADYIKTL